MDEMIYPLLSDENKVKILQEKRYLREKYIDLIFNAYCITLIYLSIILAYLFIFKFFTLIKYGGFI